MLNTCKPRYIDIALNKCHVDIGMADDIVHMRKQVYLYYL